jgi:hypothetical protein
LCSQFSVIASFQSLQVFAIRSRFGSMEVTLIQRARVRDYHEYLMVQMPHPDALRMFEAHRLCDDVIGQMEDLEQRTHLLRRLAPGGDMARIRKVLSWSGGLNPRHSRDPGNWHWGVLMWIFLQQLDNTPLKGELARLHKPNDEHKGDHWKAILGIVRF